MSSLSAPWTGLSVLAPRVDLRPVLERLRTFPEETWAEAPRLCAAGLRMVDALRVTREPAWQSGNAEVRFVRATDAGWPALLREVAQPPVALAGEGDLRLLAAPCVAIVGSRASTPYGRGQAESLARGLADAGVVVVSGLAAGIDVCAHAGAGGRTIAVLGQGIDAPMPAWQARARERLLEQGGLVVSEMHPAAHADTFTFPVRNRIIAGLAAALVVVEARERSGARNTAAHGRRYGRPVLAVPGPLGAPASAGCLDLLEEGARMVRGIHSVLQALGPHEPGEASVAGAAVARAPARAARLDAAGAAPRGPAAPPAAEPKVASNTGSGAPATALMQRLVEPTTPEQLVAALGWPYPTVMERLGVLELTGRVMRLPGRRYQVRTR